MKNKLKKEWDNFDEEHYKKVKEARKRNATITFRCTEEEKKEFFKKAEDPSGILRYFINQFKK